MKDIIVETDLMTFHFLNTKYWQYEVNDLLLYGGNVRVKAESRSNFFFFYFPLNH